MQDATVPPATPSEYPPINGTVKTPDGATADELAGRAPEAHAGVRHLEIAPPAGAPSALPASQGQAPEAQPEITQDHLRHLACYRPGKTQMELKGLPAATEEIHCPVCRKAIFHAHGVGLQLIWDIAGDANDVQLNHCGVIFSLKTLLEAQQRQHAISQQILAKEKAQPR